MIKSMVLMSYVIAFCVFGATLQVRSQINLRNFLIHRIAAQQVEKDSFYYAGMFPSYRYYAAFPGSPKSDNNIFFTALICYTLRELKPELPDSLQQVIDEMLFRAQQAYPFFQRSQYPLSYNFWPVHPPVVFPNAILLKPFRYINALPDDADDASMIWMALHPPDSVIQAYHTYMAQFANTIHRQIRNTYPRYKHLPFYNTWFGKKMPVDVDFCVLCNILSLFYTYQIPFNQHDSASIQWLEDMISYRKYLLDAAYISPHYARPPVLIYHAARLWHIAHPEWMKPYLGQLQEDAEYCLRYTSCVMDSVMLSTALVRLGKKPTFQIHMDPDKIYRIEKDPCSVFFEAGFYAMLRNPFKRWFTPLSFIKYYFSCPAYEDALILEYLIALNQANT